MGKDTGGPAFPSRKNADIYHEGMTVRDIFAGLALIGIIVTWGRAKATAEDASTAYDCADAMIAERNKQ